MEKFMRVLALAAAFALASLEPSAVFAQATPAAPEDVQEDDAPDRAASSDEAAGAVFAMTNATAGNRIVVYRRADDGTLTLAPQTYSEFPSQPHSEMSMMTPSGPLNLTSALLGRWPLPEWPRLPAAARGVSLVAPAFSILSAQASTFSTMKQMW